ncbi:uncharacterized protein LOC118466528 [Anopheles albimanus]|uniref:uncharacterized protein LOC118466528 n=1 Tax=Anopheles albimanus TaxID=7167 RepID=UPI00163DFE0E|nr:uncharacterized protein LOC118466528 [Anopheles albimanus]
MPHGSVILIPTNPTKDDAPCQNTHVKQQHFSNTPTTTPSLLTGFWPAHRAASNLLRQVQGTPTPLIQAVRPAHSYGKKPVRNESETEETSSIRHGERSTRPAAGSSVGGRVRIALHTSSSPSLALCSPYSLSVAMAWARRHLP